MGSNKLKEEAYKHSGFLRQIGSKIGQFSGGDFGQVAVPTCQQNFLNCTLTAKENN